MKTLIFSVTLVFALSAQGPMGASGGRGPSGFHGGRGRGQQIVKVVAAVQPAGTISIPVTSDQATALESMRLSITSDGKTPTYTTVSAMIVADPQIKQYLQQVARQYGTPDLAAKAKVLADAQAAYQAALAKVSGQ